MVSQVSRIRYGRSLTLALAAAALGAAPAPASLFGLGGPAPAAPAPAAPAPVAVPAQGAARPLDDARLLPELAEAYRRYTAAAYALLAICAGSDGMGESDWIGPVFDYEAADAGAEAHRQAEKFREAWRLATVARRAGMARYEALPVAAENYEVHLRSWAELVRLTSLRNGLAAWASHRMLRYPDEGGARLVAVLPAAQGENLSYPSNAIPAAYARGGLAGAPGAGFADDLRAAFELSLEFSKTAAAEVAGTPADGFTTFRETVFRSGAAPLAAVDLRAGRSAAERLVAKQEFYTLAFEQLHQQSVRQAFEALSAFAAAVENGGDFHRATARAFHDQTEVQLNILGVIGDLRLTGPSARDAGGEHRLFGAGDLGARGWIESMAEAGGVRWAQPGAPQ